MKSFDVCMPTHIYFGAGVCVSALQQERDLLKKRIMLVTTGRSLYRLGYVKDLCSEIEKISGRTDIVIYDSISSNPKLDEVEQGILVGKEMGAEVIIAFGGGSAMDAGKAIAVGIATDIPVENFLLHGETPGAATLPIIAIPTTAGTGSELSRGAIITSTKNCIKTGIRGKYILPKVAIVDSNYTLQVPLKITLETAFDVFAHAVESYISNKATIFSEMFSLEAIRIIMEALPVLKIDLQNSEARAKMCYASMLMGWNLSQVGTALPHRLQYPIGARTDTSHAAGLLALYPAWLEEVYPYGQDKLDKVASMINRGNISNQNIPGIKVLMDFIESLGIRQNLLELGIEKDEIKLLANEVTGNIYNDPCAQKAGVIEQIYCKSII